MFIISSIYLLVQYAVTAVIVAVVVLMLVRLVLNYADFNPFSRPVITVRRLTDPFVNPVRRALLGFGIGPNVAPLVTILLAILVGWLAMQLAVSVLNTAAGVLLSLQRLSLQSGALVALIGYVLYGLLAFYSMLIFIRIIFSWGMVSYSNRIMRFLVNATDPLLVPLRSMIPPIGMFDISPIIAFFILWLFQAAIAGTLLRGWPLQFFA